MTTPQPVNLHISPTRCRTPGCDEVIFFVPTAATGTPMPLNIQPDPKGNIRLQTTPLDDVLVAAVIEQAELFTPMPDVRYMPHWVTCVDPDYWRPHRQARPDPQLPEDRKPWQ